MDSVGTKIKCCPKCGSTIEMMVLCQYSRKYTLGKRGKMQKKPKFLDLGSTGSCIAKCTNVSCDARWESEEFDFDINGVFIDLKYSEKAERGDDV